MARIVDADKGALVGAWVCSECGARHVVRSRSRFVQAPKDPAERCSCSQCCYDMTCKAGTMTWEAAPSNVVPFPARVAP